MIIKRKVRLLNKSELKLIKGGLCDSPASRSISFISAYVTDTRLMGVICMYAHWIIDDEGTCTSSSILTARSTALNATRVLRAMIWLRLS